MCTVKNKKQKFPNILTILMEEMSNLRPLEGHNNFRFN
jgi:hypothetical protein